MSRQHQTDLTQMRIFLEGLMMERPEDLTLLLPEYSKLMDRLSEIEAKSLEAQSTEYLKGMELRANLDTTYSNNNTAYNIATYNADTDYQINRQNNWSEDYRHTQTLNAQGVNELVNRGIFDEMPILDLSRPSKRLY